MINTARQYIGINEFQKKQLMDYYNNVVYPLIDKDRKYKIKYSDNWCAMFCSVIAHKCGVKNFPYEVSVFYMTGLAKKAGSFTRDIKEVKAGDLIVYDWKNNGTLDHVGIITEVTPNLIKVIEGNYKNTVGLRSVKYPNNEVYGFIKVDNRNGVDVEQLARDAIRGVYGTGEERKKALGVNYEAVQKRINEILK